MKGELSGKVEGSLKDIVPLMTRMWEWAQVHYIELMVFAVALAIIAAWRRRGSKA